MGTENLGQLIGVRIWTSLYFCASISERETDVLPELTWVASPCVSTYMTVVSTSQVMGLGCDGLYGPFFP